MTTDAPRRPVLLIIMDGVGINPGRHGNAMWEAETPNLDRLYANFPHSTLHASGPAVGLPDGQMGNSEVGHLTIGCGSIIRQDVVRIDQSIESGEFHRNEAFVDALRECARAGRPMHLMGLVSNGGVHSSLSHLLALIELCRQHGVRPLLHMITDGRDTAPRSAVDHLSVIETKLHEAGGSVVSIMGRYFAMDRDKRWERTELAWRALIHGKGQHAISPESAIRAAWSAGDTDEFIRPILLPGFQALTAEDTVVSFNFRKDRPRQITAALGSKQFKGFDRGDAPLPKLVCMMPYDKCLDFPCAFEPERPEVTLAEVVSRAGLSQFHCAETEKYAHVTYFFNGQRMDPHSGECQLVVPSPGVATYDQKPEMSAASVTESVLGALGSARYGFIVVNYANGDMVGHTARGDAVIHAIEALDSEVGRLFDAATDAGYSVILTADHGNCEEYIDPMTGEPNTQHTTYPVPCIVADEQDWHLSCVGGLANIAPTVLQLMGLEQPEAMTGTSLLLKPLRKHREAVKEKRLPSAA